MGITSKCIQLLRGEPSPPVQISKPQPRAGRERIAKRKRRPMREWIGDAQPATAEDIRNAKTWSDLARCYESSIGNPQQGANWRSAAGRFERICRPNLLCDITDATLTQFAIGLRADGMGRETIRGRLTYIRAALKWAFANGIIDPSRFDVVSSKRPGGGWQWRPSRSWNDLDTYGDVRVA